MPTDPYYEEPEGEVEVPDYFGGIDPPGRDYIDALLGLLVLIILIAAAVEGVRYLLA